MVDHELRTGGVRQAWTGSGVLRRPTSALWTRGAAQFSSRIRPTEATTFSCCCVLRVAADVADGVPIGRPIANTRAYVLDEAMEPVGVGAPGELCIGGDGVARGYWRSEELTAERFVGDPIRRDSGGRIYRTGDRARWREDGQLEFLGRLDDQVKVRGYRVEPAEVEGVLRGHLAVREAAVVAVGARAEEKRLVAFTVARDGVVASAAKLREHLRATLPEPMVPTMYVRSRDSRSLHREGRPTRAPLTRPSSRASARPNGHYGQARLRTCAGKLGGRTRSIARCSGRAGLARYGLSRGRWRPLRRPHPLRGACTTGVSLTATCSRADMPPSRAHEGRGARGAPVCRTGLSARRASAPLTVAFSRSSVVREADPAGDLRIQQPDDGPSSAWLSRALERISTSSSAPRDPPQRLYPARERPVQVFIKPSSRYPSWTERVPLPQAWGRQHDGRARDPRGSAR